ncbi:unnamed protein product, partial [Arabidopsis halleri]
MIDNTFCYCLVMNFYHLFLFLFYKLILVVKMFFF